MATTQALQVEKFSSPKMTSDQKPSIPIVTHVISDEDIGALQGSKLVEMNMGRVVKLLTDPHSSMLYDRHVNALQRLVRHYTQGFPMKDLVQVFKILNVCADRVSEQPRYEQFLVDILKICSLPFLQEKSSDELIYEQIVIESISQLGYLMRVNSADVRKQICETLLSFYSEAPTTQAVQYHKGSKPKYNQKVVEDSDIAETLVKSLALLENDLPVKLAVLNVLQKFSKNSAKICHAMLRADAAHRICSRLMDVDPSGQLLFRSSEILWNLLERGDQAALTSQLNNLVCIRSSEILWNLLERGDQAALTSQLNNLVCISQLRDAFIYQLTQGFSHYDRQLRNDLLVLASMIATKCQDSPFIETGFAKQLTLFATFQEVKSHNVLVKHLKLLQNHEDFELRKLLFNILVTLSKDPCVLPILSEGHLMLALFSFVRANESTSGPREWTPAQFEELQLQAMSCLCDLCPKMLDDFMTILSEGHLMLALFSFVRANESTSGPREWTPAQFEELQLQAMSCLCDLCPKMLDDYMTVQGSTRMLLLLEWCVGPEDFAGHGNSIHGVGGRGNKRAQMRYCLRVLRSVVSTGEEMVLQDLADQGAINQIITILTNAISSNTADDSIDVEMQSDMMMILSCLCDGDMHRKELFGEAGVNVCVHYLRTNPKLLNSGLGHNRLLITAVDCVWCAVVGCYSTEDYLLEKEGVFILIDLLEACPKGMHNLILGCLLDLCENPKTVHHVLTWRGADNSSAAHLFCDIWRTEERDIGVRRDKNGAIIDVKMPLMGSLQEEKGFTPLPASCPSQAIVDVSENMRAKIYSLFYVKMPLMGSLQEEKGFTPLPASCPSQAIVDVSENMRAKIYSLFCKVGFTDLPGLTVDDHITLTVIEKYLDFKMGEVWTEIMYELDQEHVRPTTPDLEATEAISRAIENRAEIVAGTQQELLEAQQSQDVLNEQEFYAEIRENYRQKEKQLNDFTEFVARTSNYALLKAAKERQEHSIEASRLPNEYKNSSFFHETELPNLKTTTFSSRHVNIESTPSELTGGPLSNYDPQKGTLRNRKLLKQPTLSK